MADHIKTGRIGEKIALEYLREKGYSIVEVNWIIGHKEIDIIVQKNNEIVFVEVKTRGVGSLIVARECVNNNKQNNIITAANLYIKLKNVKLNARFDIIAIDITANKTYTIEHIENAYYPRPTSRRNTRSPKRKHIRH